MKKILSKSITIILTMCLLSACTSKKDNVNLMDSERFQYEYNSLNGKIDDHGNKMRELNIEKDNPIEYSSYSEILNNIENEETFWVYFGFPKCPWCRSCIEAMLDSASECGVEKIYYVNIYEGRYEYKYKNDKLKLTVTGDEDYLNLLDKLDSVLEEYTIQDDSEELIDVGEKRIYAPSLIFVKDGEAVVIAKDSELLENPYDEITDYIYEDMKLKFSEVFLLS